MHPAQDRLTVLIVGETIDGRLSTGSEDLGGQARMLAGFFGGESLGVLTGHACEPAARSWSEAAGMPVVILDHAHCRYPNPALNAAGIEALAIECSPLAICFPHSLRACQAAAMLAWRLRVPCITAVESVFKASGQVMLKRSIFSGKLCETLANPSMPMVLTIMPGLFLPGDAADHSGYCPSVESRRLQSADHRFIPQGVDRWAGTPQDLAKAQVVVAGGRGLGEPGQKTLLDKVAGMFKNAAVGGSRGACDLQWLPHSRQIGETGRTVSPALYLACGISGAPQHLAGMRGSQTIVAVNTDPRAAILNAAHYAVIEDLTVFLPMLRERYDRKIKKGLRIRGAEGSRIEKD